MPNALAGMPGDDSGTHGTRNPLPHREGNGLGLSPCPRGPSALKPTGDIPNRPDPDRASPAMIAEGTPAPDFTLPDQSGTPVTLSTLRGKPVVLYFYPKDDTPGCTTEACAFRDARTDYERAGARVLGVSPDTVSSHRKFADKHALTFTLLADPEKSVISSYGVWKEKTLYGKTSLGVERGTFVIDRDGVIRKIFARVKVDGHAGKVLEELGKL